VSHFLLDTQILLWAANGDPMSALASAIIADPANRLTFSAVSIWEVAIKSGLGRPDFEANPSALRRGLLDNGYQELSITSAHAAAVIHLPPIHKDPFDRLLLAQAQVEGLILLTADAVLAGYPGAITRV
jgi:PIN domain nuclease of toxin-antitoxin system